MIRARPCDEVGDDAGLRAGERAGLGAERGDGHRDQRVGDPLAGGQQHVQLPGRRGRRHLLREVHQLVGGVAHRRDDDDHLVAVLAGRHDPFGHALDALRRADRRTAVLLDDQAHCCSRFRSRSGRFAGPHPHVRLPSAVGWSARFRSAVVQRSRRPSSRHALTRDPADPRPARRRRSNRRLALRLTDEPREGSFTASDCSHSDRSAAAPGRAARHRYRCASWTSVSDLRMPMVSGDTASSGPAACLP